MHTCCLVLRTGVFLGTDLLWKPLLLHRLHATLDAWPQLSQRHNLLPADRHRYQPHPTFLLQVVEKVTGKLLMTAVADPSERVRRTVLQALASSSSLDDHLAQADCLRALFVALNDESFNIRGITISLVGRLAQRNPAYVNPALRRHLLQLLTDMECSPDSRWAAGGQGSCCLCLRLRSLPYQRSGISRHGCVVACGWHHRT